MAGFRTGGALFAVVAALLVPAAAQAQDEPPPSVLLVMDASDSMNEDIGGGRTRLDAAKEAMRAAIEAIPDDARVGLRLYGHRLSGVSRRRGCTDTELVVPVGPLDREALTAQIESYEAKGRTPIGRSLRAAAGDLQDAPGRRRIVLVSDGGDNCAPPVPCDVAREIAGDVELTISAVGFVVSERARRQLECIARAGGGSYTDAADPDELTAELRAAFARSFRDYDPQGEPIEGGASEIEAVPVEPGQYLDSLSGAGQERWYAVELARGERLWATATIVRPDTVRGDAGAHILDIGKFELVLSSPTDEEAETTSTAFFAQLRDVSGRGESLTVRGLPAGTEDELGYEQAGTYFVHVSLERVENFETVEFPLELILRRVTDLPDRVAPDDEPAPTPTPTPTPAPTRTPAATADDEESSGFMAGAAGLALGLVAGGGLALARRRRGP
jgi:Ca-activated chloride channel homolog